MYVNEKTRPLTFEDLTRAVRRSAGMSGLGQDLMNEIITAQGGDTFNPNDPSYIAQSASSMPSGSASPLTAAQAAFLAGPTTPTLTTSAMPWGTLGLVAAGLILFGLVVGNPK